MKIAIFVMLLSLAVTATASTFTIVHSFPADGYNLQCGVQVVPCDPVSPLVKIGIGHFLGFGAGSFGYYDSSLYDLNGSTATKLYDARPSGVAQWQFAVASGATNIYFSNGGGIIKLVNNGGTWTNYLIKGAVSGVAYYAVVFDEVNGILYGNGRTINTNPYTYFIWKLTSGGQYTVLKTWQPVAGALNITYIDVDSAGSLYGTTTTTGTYSCGEFWKYDPSGSGAYTSLFSFPCRTNGTDMGVRSVTLDSNRNAYGQSGYGGANDAGQVWKLTNVSGTYPSMSTIYSFGGSSPIDNGFGDKVAVDGSGNIYGTVSYSSSFNGCGFAYEVSQSGTLLGYHQFVPLYPGLEGCGGEFGPVNGGNGMYGITQYDPDWTTSGAVWKIQ